MPVRVSFPDATVLALFIQNTVTGWIVLIPVVAAIVAVAVIGASTLASDVYRAHPVAKHHQAPGRKHTPVLVPAGAEPRPAKHAMPDPPTEPLRVADLVTAAAA